MSKWKIDPNHGTAEFKVQHLGIAWVLGQIYGITGDIEFDPASPETAKFNAEIDLNTLTTGQEQRDGHLKSADFFDVVNHPQMKFESTKFEKVDDKNYKLTGNLTIKDTTKEVEIAAQFLGETDKPAMDGTDNMLHVAAFSLHTKLDRRDFGLTWNVDLPGGKVLVGNEVEIEVEFEAIKE